MCLYFFIECLSIQSIRESRNLRQEGWGGREEGPGPTVKKSLTTFFFVLNLSYRGGPVVYFSDLFHWLISRETIIFQVSSGGGGGDSQHFPWMGSNFSYVSL